MLWVIQVNEISYSKILTDSESAFKTGQFEHLKTIVAWILGTRTFFSNISCLGTRRQGGIGKSNLNSGRVGLFSKRHGGIGKSSLNWIFSPWFSLTCGNIFFMVVNIWSHFSHFMQVIPEVQSSRAALWCRNEVSFPVAKSHLLQE